MPSIRASSRVNLRGWQPASNTLPTTPPARPSPTTEPTPSRSPYMRAAMPLMASTSDSFTRQFYSGSNVPQQRLMPVANGTPTNGTPK